jgi:ABC-type Fe3+/spermidine/putrescine transport system ATPase subunit
MLEAIQICKSFPLRPGIQSPKVLDQVSLSVKTGEFMTLLGPSGCGKTTFLRCVAGLEKPDQGDLLFKSKSILLLPTQQRPFHMVFQKYALFPHMSVFENIEFSLKNKGVIAGARRKRSEELLELMGLAGFGDRKPSSLSGGQAQRVALARALADQPEMLLLDEPFSALDEKIRVQLRAEMKNLQKKLGLTFLFVTHDQQEALQMSDRIAVFNEGRVEQIGAPEDLFFKPETIFVAEFLGEKNLISRNGHSASYISPEKISFGQKTSVQIQGQVELCSIAGPFYDIRIRDILGKLWIVYNVGVRGQEIKIGENVTFGYNLNDVIYVNGVAR